jgi:hypothetical protein
MAMEPTILPCHSAIQSRSRGDPAIANRASGSATYASNVGSNPCSRA